MAPKKKRTMFPIKQKSGPRPGMIYQRHFFYHDSSNKDHLAERELCHWCQIGSFDTHCTYPITITNDVDNETLSQDFRFVDHNHLDEDVHPAEEEFKSGCDCSLTRDCQYAECHCLQDVMLDEDHEPHRNAHSYYSQGEHQDCLIDVKLGSRDPIYECHNGCSCNENCTNRVVERGRKVPLNIFRTEDGRGWGVRSDVVIKKGQFIDRYIGQIITASEANRRREESDVAQRKDVYLFALDKFSDPESMDPRLSGPPYEVDGEFMSGPTRFINHSCEPNLRIFARVGDHADKHIHDLAFFAIEEIPPLTELTFDYVDGEDTDLVEDSRNDHTLKDMTQCLCGSKKCRGFLW